jgi:hypothetical protein
MTCLEMTHRDLLIRVVLSESLEDDGVCPFAVEFDLAIWSSNDRRHPLPSRVKLANVEDLKLLRGAIDVDEDRLWLSSL